MAKGIIVLDEIPRSCVDCPMYYHAEDMSLGKFKYERLYKCKIMPEEVEQVYLEDILHKKPVWCKIRPIPDKLESDSRNAYEDFDYVSGWNACLDEIERNGEK